MLITIAEKGVGPAPARRGQSEKAPNGDNGGAPQGERRSTERDSPPPSARPSCRGPTQEVRRVGHVPAGTTPGRRRMRRRPAAAVERDKQEAALAEATATAAGQGRGWRRHQAGEKEVLCGREGAVGVEIFHNRRRAVARASCSQADSVAFSVLLPQQYK